MQVFASERTVIADLPSIDDSKAGFIETESAGPAHVSLDGIGNASSGGLLKGFLQHGPATSPALHPLCAMKMRFRKEVLGFLRGR